MLYQKQKRFCEEYVIDLNATQAAIRAGYSKNTARSTASEYLAKPNIQNLVKLSIQNTAYSIGSENLRKPQIKITLLLAKLFLFNLVLEMVFSTKMYLICTFKT